MSEACPTKNMAQKILRWINERIFFQLSKVSASGGTNFELAFSTAFDMFESSIAMNKTSHCQKALLFLTDGFITVRQFLFNNSYLLVFGRTV